MIKIYYSVFRQNFGNFNTLFWFQNNGCFRKPRYNYPLGPIPSIIKMIYHLCLQNYKTVYSRIFILLPSKNEIPMKMRICKVINDKDKNILVQIYINKIIS